MYEIKKQIYLNLTKNQKSALCNYLRALVKKSPDLTVDEIWDSFTADELYYIELNCSRFEFLAEILDDEQFKSDTLKYLKECKNITITKNSKGRLSKHRKNLTEKNANFCRK